MNHSQTVQEVYAAFGRGDVAAILARCADNVDWDNTRVESREVPWNGNFSGKDKLPGFFTGLAQELDFKVFDIQAIIAEGPYVAVNLQIESVSKKTGKALKNNCMHLWTFANDGKIAKYRHFNDTAAELAAWRG